MSLAPDDHSGLFGSWKACTIVVALALSAFGSPEADERWRGFYAAKP